MRYAVTDTCTLAMLILIFNNDNFYDIIKSTLSLMNFVRYIMNVTIKIASRIRHTELGKVFSTFRIFSANRAVPITIDETVTKAQ